MPSASYTPPTRTPLGWGTKGAGLRLPCSGSLAKGHSGDNFFVNFLSKGACFWYVKIRNGALYFYLGGSNGHSPAQPHITLVLGSRSLSPVALVPNPCELCVAGRDEMTCRSPQRGPCDGPATAQASLFPVVALNTSLNFCANDATPVPVTENQGFTLWHYVSSYHPCSSSLGKQNQKHLHNNRPKIIYG